MTFIKNAIFHHLFAVSSIAVCVFQKKFEAIIQMHVVYNNAMHVNIKNLKSLKKLVRTQKSDNSKKLAAHCQILSFSYKEI